MRRTLLPLALLSLSLVSAADLHTGYFRGRKVTFRDVNGLAVYQGDIILGTSSAIETAQPAGKTRESSTVTAAYLWPNGIIPYEIDATDKPDENVVKQAVDYWNTHTPIDLRPRATTDGDFVRFSKGTSTIACSSSVGMMGGEQTIYLPDGCGVGEAIHEIGHAVGLWHEMSRNDRNKYVTIEYGNIDKGSYSQFDKTFSEGIDAGFYDLSSIMHYGPYDFARDDLSVTMESVPAGIPMGQRDHLSAGDVDAVQRLYGEPPSQTVVATNPSGLKVLVDGNLIDDGTAFDWADGERHTVEAPFQGDDQTRYLFGNWSDQGAAKHVIVASKDRTVYLANFIIQRKVTVTITPPGSGSVTLDPASPDGFYTDRSYVKIAAAPSPGYYFLKWSATPSRSMNPKFMNIDGRTVVTNLEATFVDSPVTTITSNPPGRLISTGGDLYSTPVNFQWRAGESHTVTVDTTQPSFEHFRFTGWSDGTSGSLVVNSTGEAATYTANFTKQHSLTTTSYSTTSSIRIDPDSADGFYDEGTQVTLTAAPAGTSEFLRWTGDLSGDANPAKLTMNEQKEVRATFVPPSQIPPIVPVNAASNLADPFDPIDTAPGEIITIYGLNLSGVNLTTAQLAGEKVATRLAGVRVLFNKRFEGPLVYVSENQVAAVTPYELTPGSIATLDVEFNGQVVASGELNMMDAAPGIFTVDSSGQGRAAIIDEHGARNPSTPVRRGSTIALYVTGDGAQTPAMATGQISDTTSISNLSRPVLPVSVRIGGVPCILSYAGAAPGAVSGLMQINAMIPDGILTGPHVPIVVVVGDKSSPEGVTIAVE